MPLYDGPGEMAPRQPTLDPSKISARDVLLDAAALESQGGLDEARAPSFANIQSKTSGTQPFMADEVPTRYEVNTAMGAHVQLNQNIPRIDTIRYETLNDAPESPLPHPIAHPINKKTSEKGRSSSLPASNTPIHDVPPTKPRQIEEKPVTRLVAPVLDPHSEYQDRPARVVPCPQHPGSGHVLKSQTSRVKSRSRSLTSQAPEPSTHGRPSLSRLSSRWRAWETKVLIRSVKHTPCVQCDHSEPPTARPEIVDGLQGSRPLRLQEPISQAQPSAINRDSVNDQLPAQAKRLSSQFQEIKPSSTIYSPWSIPCVRISASH